MERNQGRRIRAEEKLKIARFNGRVSLTGQQIQRAMGFSNSLYNPQADGECE